MKKMSSELRIAKFLIICKTHLLMPVYQSLVSQPQIQNQYIYIKFLSIGYTFYLSSAIFRITYEKN